MVISVALSNALTGLQAAQATINTIADNVSNANTPGYTQKTAPLTNVVAGGIGAGVMTGTVQRRVDELLNRDLRRESSTLGSASVTNGFMQDLQNLIGATAQGGVLNTSLGNLQSAMNALAVTPSDPSLQQSVTDAAAATAQTLNRVESAAQTMRGNADSQISTAVQTVNNSLQQIQTLNQQIARANALNEPIGGLQDQRDQAIATVAQYVGIQTFTRDDGETVVYTSKGRALVDGVATLLSYTPAASSTASSTPFSNITLGADKANITSELTSGKIQALVQVRDQTLPELSKELNVIARGLYEQSWAPPSQPVQQIQAVGNLQSNATVGTFTDVNYTGNFGLHDSSGNAFNATLRFVNTGPNTWRVELNNLTRQSDGSVPSVATGVPPGAPALLSPAAPLQLGTYNATTQTFTQLPVPGTPTGSLTLPVITTQVGSEPATFMGQAGPPPVPANFSFDLNQLTSTTAATSVQPLNNTYRLFQGVNIVNPQTDNAATIKLNAVFDGNNGGNPGNLFVAGDQTPSVIQRMATGLAAAIDTTKPPYSTIGAHLPAGQVSLVQYSNALLAQNAVQAADAKSTNDFQSQYVTTLTQQSQSISGVNVDQELANLTVFQNSYQASARVLTTANALIEALLAIQ
jgi:flagellar hook-associated protein 1 FlgK